MILNLSVFIESFQILGGADRRVNKGRAHRALANLFKLHSVTRSGESIPAELLRRSVEVTDTNAAFFDAANGYAGCIAGLHEVLRRQGLLEGIWCLDARVTLSPGQGEEIARVHGAYPHLNDDEFVGKHLDQWLRP